jgi:hypothetical protein
MLRLVTCLAVAALFAAHLAFAADPVSVQVPADEQVLHLGAKHSIPVTVTASQDFEGTVELAADLSDLAQPDPQGHVKATVDPSMVQLTPGSRATVTLEVTTSSLAPTIPPRMLGVKAKAVSATGTTTLSRAFGVSVDAIFEIRLYGGPAPESWDSPLSVSFAPHAEGVLVRFINMDSSVSHTIHSSGPIPHGSAAIRPGGTYEYRVTGSQRMRDQYYCHDHENGGPATRTLLFNQ